jgi:hypothetical protein
MSIAVPSGVIHVLDVLAVSPGRLDDVRHRIDGEYRLPMVELGMRLVHTWIAPAVELQDQPTELVLLWELDDVAAYWRMRTTAARSGPIMAFWAAITPMLARRERKLMCDPADERVLR